MDTIQVTEMRGATHVAMWLRAMLRYVRHIRGATVVRVSHVRIVQYCMVLGVAMGYVLCTGKY